MGRNLSHFFRNPSHEICWNCRDRGSLFPLGLPGKRNEPLMLLVVTFTLKWDGLTESEVDTGGKRRGEEGAFEGIISSWAQLTWVQLCENVKWGLDLSVILANIFCFPMFKFWIVCHLQLSLIQYNSSGTIVFLSCPLGSFLPSGFNQDLLTSRLYHSSLNRQGTYQSSTTRSPRLHGSRIGI